MRYQTKLFVVAFLLLGISLSATALSNWGIERSVYTLERSRLASRHLEIYLELSRHVNEASLQSAIAMLNGESDQAIALAPPSSGVTADTSRIQTIVGAEIELVDGQEKAEERKELTRILQISDDIGAWGDVLRQAARARASALENTAGQPVLSAAQIDLLSVLRKRIDAAIADEAGEVAATETAARAVYANLSLATQAHAVVAALVAIGSLLLLLRGLRHPLRELTTGTQALASGKLTHHIKLPGRDEFASLAKSFNAMAEQLTAQRAQLSSAKTGLERAVVERTGELRKANEALERSSAARRRFLADVSHELRTPLTIIRGEAQVTLRNEPAANADYKRALERISEQAEQMSMLVNDLLFIARQDADEAGLNFDEVEIDDLVKKTCEVLKGAALKKDIVIRCRCEDHPLTVPGDAARLRQVFTILLDNAICYSNPKGHVYVDLFKGDDHIAADVQDDGIGIDPSEVDHVFERYRRGINAGEYNADGLGLGLPVAKAIIDAHRGKIEVHSKPAGGTTVRVKLPLEHDGDA